MRHPTHESCIIPCRSSIYSDGNRIYSERINIRGRAAVTTKSRFSSRNWEFTHCSPFPQSRLKQDSLLHSHGKPRLSYSRIKVNAMSYQALGVLVPPLPTCMVWFFAKRCFMTFRDMLTQYDSSMARDCINLLHIRLPSCQQ
jgi:hypothetical protein